MGEGTPPPDELIQKARNKSSPKIHVWVLKIPINVCDHMKIDVVEFPCSWIFERFKQDLGINLKPLFELRFKYLEFQKCSKDGTG